MTGTFSVSAKEKALLNAATNVCRYWGHVNCSNFDVSAHTKAVASTLSSWTPSL